MNLVHLGDAIYTQDADGFIREYLTCHVSGYSLPCPNGADLDSLINEWGAILPRYNADFSDEFCADVAKKWLDLYNQCHPIDTDIRLKMAAVLGVEPVTNLLPNTRHQKTTVADIPQDIQSDGGLTSAISDGYREHQTHESNQKKGSIEALERQRFKAFKSGNVRGFLTAHLSMAGHEHPQQIPKSTVPANIRYAWESILTELYNTIASDEFLEAITNDWFYLVNQRGIPVNAESQVDILRTYSASHRPAQSDVSPRKKASRSSIFGWLFKS